MLFLPLKSQNFKKVYKINEKNEDNFDWKHKKYESLYTFLQDVRDFEKRVSYKLHGPVHTLGWTADAVAESTVTHKCED